MVADIMTKALDRNKHNKFSIDMGLTALNANTIQIRKGIEKDHGMANIAEVISNTRTNIVELESGLRESVGVVITDSIQ